MRIRRRTSNEDVGAACDGSRVQSERCPHVHDEECPEDVCVDYYEKCSKISKVFCTDLRYKARVVK